LWNGVELVRKEGASSKSVVETAEKKAGVVAENMSRLLMMVDYVARKQGDLDEDSSFLFAPPVLSTEDDIEDVTDKEESDDEEEETESESEEDEEDETSESRKRRSRSSNAASKRTKKTKLIAWQQPYKHRNALQEAWLSILRLPNIPIRTTKRILQHLSTYVLTVCPSPLRFAEYFTRSYELGITSNSLTSILSLHGLIILMLDHQLEYPQFYNSLYRLLHPRIFYSKNRTGFLRLLSKALLSNSMLPAYVVASFCKRMLRMGLSAPPSGGLFVLALTSNLIRKHGECACLIHRRGKNEEGGMIKDVFLADVDDLAKTRALESSLWELTALEQHYHPAISTLAKVVGTEDDKTTPMYDMEDFMTHTYKSLFEQEKKRLGTGGGGGRKKKVSLTFVEPAGLFIEGDVFSSFWKCS